MANETATFSLKIDADAEPALESAAALEKYRASIQKSQEALAAYRKSQSLLKGSSAEVVDAKAKLRAAIELEKGKISASNLQILKLGGSYDKLSKAQKKTTEATLSGRKAVASVGGPLKDLLERFEGFEGIMPALATGWGAFAAAIAVGVAALALAGAALGSLTLKFTEWLLTTADANRNLALTREAFTGNAAESAKLGYIIAHTREEVSLTTAELNKLAVANDQNLRGSRITGVGMAHQFHAIALAAGAGREDVVSAFNEIIARGKLTGRAFITLRDFQPGGILAGKGIKAADAFKALGVGARGGVVSTTKMAEALDKLATNRFAEVNAKKALSLGGQWDHLKDRFMAFTDDLVKEGGALEPLLKAIGQLGEMFDQATPSGLELKRVITEYGTALSKAIINHLPEIKQFAKNVVELTAKFVEAGAAIVNFATSEKGLTTIKIALLAVAAAGVAVFVAFLPLIVVGAAIALAFIAVGAAIYGVYKLGQWIVNLDWAGIGKAIVEGIKTGIENAWTALKGAITSMGEGLKKVFEHILGIASPSKVFLEYGVQTGAGYQAGLAASQAGVRSAGAGLAGAATEGARAAPVSPTAVLTQPAPAEPSAVRGTSQGMGGGMHVGTISNTFIIQGAKDAEAVKSALSSQSFLEGFESTIKALLQSQGIATGGPVLSGG